ncbi:MAG: hypothetical protein MK108_04735 [Mariniblastus sp.]|nr:hypothetical protein [Mariniblastus sp.]
MTHLKPQYQDVVSKVSELSQIHLARLAHVPSGAPVSRSFLMQDDFFYGLEFRLGAFRAVWLIGSDVIEVFGGDQPLDLIYLPADSARRAA